MKHRVAIHIGQGACKQLYDGTFTHFCMPALIARLKQRIKPLKIF